MSTPSQPEASDISTLQQLNEQYISAILNADVGWYSKHLSEDFRCITSDGAVRDKRQFLEDVAAGPEVKDYKLSDVSVRLYGGTALVQAKGTFTRRDGSPGQSRYTDVYVKTDHSWRVVSAQITRAPSETSD
jgi:ketosteroid isomerase-like protein